MSAIEMNLVEVTLLDRNYRIKCPEEEAHELRLSAQYLDEQMRKLRQSATRPSQADGVAVVAALNICHDLLQIKKQKNNYIEHLTQRIQSLERKIQNFLASTKEVDV